MLTKKQHELICFIADRLAETGVSPSFEEMKDALDLKSKSGVHRLISGSGSRRCSTMSVIIWMTATQQLQCPNPVTIQTAKGNLMFDSITADFAHTNIKGTRLRGKFLVEDLP